ncbi:hypothetical protein EMCRGX_G026535 [Ephydatia muelleri]
MKFLLTGLVCAWVIGRLNVRDKISLSPALSSTRHLFANGFHKLYLLEWLTEAVRILLRNRSHLFSKLSIKRHVRVSYSDIKLPH